MPIDGYGRHTPNLSGNRIVRALSIDDALISHVSDAIAQLTFSSQWVEVGDTVEDITDECKDALDSWYLGNMLIGQISSFVGALPNGWLAMDGSTYDRDDYPELWDALDSGYKDSTTFTLPNFEDLFVAGAGNSYSLGDTGGESSHTLTEGEIPSHNHSYIQPTLTLSIGAVGAPELVAEPSPGASTGNTGSGNAHENRPPFIAANIGIFAGRY
jgi:microcystin-dependent protein